ncbi:zeta toxin family protein [Allobranchiibius sp. CTAmp26]|uniref:zeta toxin family protein n=1 Tax=Allobranchiibius sp. CTAmp26 TaxID=2815214 RepID=UPI001AA178C6|nr:AAA family ATPase [Allobranchiibius sp. CTAmp26]MBO1756937.1 kinase [Allobranchiibius sp. CTAmp26]
MTGQQLIILRGNSGAGKTPLAQQLQLAMGRGTANIGQDHLRRIVLREHDVVGGDNIGLIASTVRYCLGLGYHVIVEGIFFSGHYGDMLLELIDTHTGPAHVFYLDVPLEETLRRHEGRPMRAEVEPDQLRSWYLDHDLLGVPDEVLDHSRDLVGTTQHILDRIGPTTAKTDANSSRFL